MVSSSVSVDEALALWSRLAAPLPPEDIEWRQDGKAIQRDGEFLARFVAYVEAVTVRDRLDEVVPGEWDLTLDILPTPSLADDSGEVLYAFKCRLQILGVVREDVGQGKDYKSAATDAFKRAAVRFGIARELYRYGQNWVRVDSDGKYARPLENPGTAYARRHLRALPTADGTATGSAPTPSDAGNARQIPPPAAPSAAPTGAPVASPTRQAVLVGPKCPKCGGQMWDNRKSKRNPKAPDYKCRNRTCEGVIWPALPPEPEDYPDELRDEELETEDEKLPF